MNGNALPKIERNLFLPALAGFFIAGVWLAPRMETGWWPLWLLLLTALLIIPFRLLRLPMRLLCLPLALLCAMLWTQHWLYPAMPVEGERETITATVYGDSHVTDSGNVAFSVTDVVLDGEPQRGKAYAYLYSDYGEEPAELLDGTQIQFSGEVYYPYAKDNEYDFDFPMWMRQNGLQYGITAITDLQTVSGDRPWTDYAQRIAQTLHTRLAVVMGEQADLAVAMLLGYRDALAEDDTAAFQRAGVAHIMAVSGLHVGILSLALLWMLERLRVRKKWQIPVVALFLLGYCGITGFAVSSLRAGVMVLLWVTAKAYGRQTNPITIVSTAVLIVLIINPLQLFSAGFALSFAAVAGIFLLYPRLMQGLNRIWSPVKVKKRQRVHYALHRRMEKGKQTLAMILSAQLGVLLPVAAYYHALYPYGLLFNLLIVPFAGFLVPLFAVTAILVMVPGVGEWLGIAPGFLAGIGSEALLRLVRLSMSLPLAEIRVARPGAWIITASLACGVIVSRFVRASVRRRLLAMGAVIVIAVSGTAASRPAPLRYHQFAAGWADAALIVDHETTIGIDTGNTGSEMINRLLSEGRDLDVLILTHLHSDHAGGVDEILDAGIRIGQVYLPVDYERQAYGADSLAIVDRLLEAEVPVATLMAGDTLEFRETTIEVLWPQEGRTRLGIDPNDRSLAMLITLGNVRILSMADNGILYERYAEASADILKTGHHGSRQSSGEEFLEAVNPTLALITVRADSAVPSAEVLERMDALSIRVMRTDETGEITIVPTQDGYRAYRYRSEEMY